MAFGEVEGHLPLFLCMGIRLSLMNQHSILYWFFNWSHPIIAVVLSLPMMLFFYLQTLNSLQNHQDLHNYNAAFPVDRHYL